MGSKPRNHFESGRAGDKFANGVKIYLTATKFTSVGPFTFMNPFACMGPFRFYVALSHLYIGPYATRPFHSHEPAPPPIGAFGVVCAGSEFLF